MHQAIELALAEPSDLSAPTTNHALARVIGNNVVARAKGFDGHLFDLCGLGAGAALNDLLDHRAGGLAWLMLPMIIATADHEARLVPDDLRADVEAACLQARCEGGGVKGGVPDIDHVAGKQRPCLAPVGAVVVQDRSLCQSLRCYAALLPPGWIVVHAITVDRSRSRCGFTPFEDTRDIVGIGAVAADQAMIAEEPDIARHADRLLRNVGNVVGIGQALRAAAGQRQHLELAEAGQRQVEAEASSSPSSSPSSSSFQPAFSASLLSAMTSARFCASLSPASSMTGTVRHAELPRREQPAMSGNDAVVAVDQDRVCPAELADGCRDLRNLRIRMRAGVLREWDQSRGRAVFDREGACAAPLSPRA